jgi:hypothetical protein
MMTPVGRLILVRSVDKRGNINAMVGRAPALSVR